MAATRRSLSALMAAPAFGAPDVAAELERICASAAFAHSRRQQQFLRYLVDRQRSGTAAAAREMTVGIEFFQRPAGNYDPKRDPIVRVEARRLRDRLARYYDEEGSAATIEIAIPVGSYAPVIRARVPTAPEATPSAHSVVVLPVANLTGDPQLDLACDGLTEELIDQLSRRPSVRVTARTSAQAAVAGAYSLAAIVQKLRVAWVLEAALRADGGGLRLSLGLVETGSQHRVWSKTATSPSGSAADLRWQAVVSVLIEGLPFVAADRAPAKPGPAPTPEHERARDLTDRARYLSRMRKQPETELAIRLAREATQLSPDYAAAWTVLGGTLLLRMSFQATAPDQLAQVRSAFETALALRPDDAEALSQLAFVAEIYDHDFAGAARLYERVLELAPGNATVRARMAQSLVWRGEFERAREQYAIAQQLDPLNLSLRLSTAIFHSYTREHGRSRRIFDDLLEIDASHYIALIMASVNEIWAHEDLGRARGLVERARIVDPENPTGDLVLAMVDALDGDHASATAALASVARRFQGRYVSPMQRAMVYGAMRDAGGVIREVHRAREAGDQVFVYAPVMPLFAWLADDPGFNDCLREVGLPGWVGVREEV
jgi:TolB-like protein/tetratricopeptide (TPR) repeat protein